MFWYQGRRLMTRPRGKGAAVSASRASIFEGEPYLDEFQIDSSTTTSLWSALTLSHAHAFASLCVLGRDPASQHRFHLLWPCNNIAPLTHVLFACSLGASDSVSFGGYTMFPVPQTKEITVNEKWRRNRQQYTRCTEVPPSTSSTSPTSPQNGSSTVLSKRRNYQGTDSICLENNTERSCILFSGSPSVRVSPPLSQVNRGEREPMLSRIPIAVALAACYTRRVSGFMNITKVSKLSTFADMSFSFAPDKSSQYTCTRFLRAFVVFNCKRDSDE